MANVNCEAIVDITLNDL